MLGLEENVIDENRLGAIDVSRIAAIGQGDRLEWNQSTRRIMEQ